jgi:hypothetical protein
VTVCGAGTLDVAVFIRSPLLHYLQGHRVGSGRDDGLFDDVVHRDSPKKKML